ncbi:MAG: GSCFA family protein [Rhodobacteraceae bacterium]|nr:GSCFA family protein [Paracoccaceae bacterium]
MDHPYIGLEKSAYWRSAVSDLNALELRDVFAPKFPISRSMAICAAGSCFAQHIGRQFKQRKFKFIDLEPPLALLEPEMLPKFGLDMYSARYGNIYSIRQLLQMFKRANGSFIPEETVWETNGRFYDPFRPSIEPNGFESLQELEQDRAHHLARVNRLLNVTDLFVFTFGLTEGWINKSDGSVLPTCPGTIAGEYDDSKYEFHNFTHAEVLADAEEFIAYALAINPDMKFMFTVSPVPLTATASGQHVLPATVYSKSVLRGVCGELFQKYPQVDYFPSYELVSAHPMRAMFYNPNLRGVSALGVAHVMNVFFNAIGDTGLEGGEPASDDSAEARAQKEEAIACDEMILEAFGK